MTNHAAEIAITGLVIATLKMENPEHILLTWCAISGIMSGYVGSILFPVRGVKLHSRWIMSVVCAVVAGPILTSLTHVYVAKYAPMVTQLQLALFISFLCAVFGVLVIKLCEPYLKPALPIIGKFLISLLPPALVRLFTPDDSKKNGRHGT